MRCYETVWVVNGDLPDEEVKATVDKFTRIISTQGGLLVGVDEWGRRKLAYRVESATRGYYVLAEFAGLPETVKELERNYRIDDRIIRYHTIKKSDKVDLEALHSEIAARAKAAAPAPEAEAAPRVEEAAQVEEAPGAPPEEVASPVKEE